MIIDAKDLVLGRISSRIAKKLLEGEEVIVVNAEKAVISGSKKSTLSEYEAWTEIRNLVDPTQGPFHLGRSSDLVRRAVRGMLPMKKAKGREAYHRLRVYSGIPADIQGKEKKTFPKAHLDQLGTRRFIRIKELTEHLGKGP